MSLIYSRKLLILALVKEYSRHSDDTKVVLLSKENKPPDEPSSYRPLCMLDIAGKLFQRIISVRLEAAIQQVGSLCDNQFGFRKGRSTIDAINRVVAVAKNAVSGSWCTKRMCAMIGLDIRNAFNTARWDKIMTTVRILIRSQEVCRRARY